MLVRINESRKNLHFLSDFKAQCQGTAENVYAFYTLFRCIIKRTRTSKADAFSVVMIRILFQLRIEKACETYQTKRYVT